MQALCRGGQRMGLTGSSIFLTTLPEKKNIHCFYPVPHLFWVYTPQRKGFPLFLRIFRLARPPESRQELFVHYRSLAKPKTKVVFPQSKTLLHLRPSTGSQAKY